MSNTTEYDSSVSLVRQSRVNSGIEQAKLVARGLAADFGYSANDLLRSAERR